MSTARYDTNMDNYDDEVKHVFHAVGPSQTREVKRVVMSQCTTHSACIACVCLCLCHCCSSSPCSCRVSLPDKPILSSTMLQMLLYYNLFYSLAYAWFFVLAFRWKVRTTSTAAAAFECSCVPRSPCSLTFSRILSRCVCSI